jgi:peptide/nickel transport system substrate-binding protein
VTTTTPTAVEPTYGGTFTYLHRWYYQDPVSFDDVTTAGLSPTCVWVNPYAECLLEGDINKFGPRGNNSFSFQYNLVNQFGQYYGPALATSWEVTQTPFGVVYHLRHGVMFTGNTKIGMAPRELTADDVAFHINRLLTSSSIKSIYNSYIKSVTATDRYTVTILWSSFYSQWESPIGMDCGVQSRIIPPEVAAAGADNWKNASGTGPYIITDYVSGSYASYTRNPNYWGTTTINGKLYQEPLISKVVYPIIVDESTAIAALRTGKVDMWPAVPSTYQTTLAKSSPDMTINKWLFCFNYWIRFNCLTSKYFTNKDVRRAMFMATDLKAIRDNVFQGGNIYSFPAAPGTPEYTPPEQYPASVTDEFTYDPVKAKQLLATAGFPNGFTCELTVNPTSVMHDIADTLVSEWAKAGVTLTIDARDSTAFQAAYTKVLYDDSVIATHPTDDAWGPLFACRPGGEGCAVNDPVYNALYDKAQATQDTAARVALKQQLGIYLLDNAFGIPLTNQYVLDCYWPWLKNYYGEVTAGNYNDIMPFVSQMWIDENMKTSMGY